MKKSVLMTALVAFLFSMNVNAQEQEPKQKKEVLISMSSAYYKNASQVIEGFLKQAQISDFFIDLAQCHFRHVRDGIGIQPQSSIDGTTRGKTHWCTSCARVTAPSHRIFIHHTNRHHYAGGFERHYW